MESIKQFFSYMNEISFPYVVLRNWERLPYDASLGEHSDLDLLVYDFEHWKEIFPCARAEYSYPRVRMKIPIDDSYIYADVRHTGDDYYPVDFEKAILDTREWNDRGFWTPNPLHHRIALAYHCVHHKAFISDNYRKYIGDATIPEMLQALKMSQIGWIKPKDASVGSFNGYWKGATSIVSDSDGMVTKSQYGYKEYPLIKNEYDILSSVSSVHFPAVRSFLGDTLSMEHCGEALNPSNLPVDWEAQLQSIIRDLDENGIVHRDIRLENLMVKDDIIKLIDFGWAVRKGERWEKSPPSCLGYPNKPSWGFDDAYSMNQVIKQIKFELEDIESRGVVA